MNQLQLHATVWDNDAIFIREKEQAKSNNMVLMHITISDKHYFFFKGKREINKKFKKWSLQRTGR